MLERLAQRIYRARRSMQIGSESKGGESCVFYDKWQWLIWAQSLKHLKNSKEDLIIVLL